MAACEGGYNYDFVEPPPERLLCKICQLPCREAQSNEDHVYCKGCVAGIQSSASVDHDIKALKIYCPNKDQNGCGWIGELSRVDDHLRGCEISCSKCKQIVYLSTMKSHLDTECPCYCPYCDMTAEREVISSEHKENCHKFPLICPNNNIGVDNVPRDKFDKTNNIIESQNEMFSKIIDHSVLVELHKDISTFREEAAQSLQIAKACSDKVDKQNAGTLLNQVFNIRSNLTIAVMIIAILIALLLSQHQIQTNLSQYIATELNNISLLVSEQMSEIIGMDYKTKQQLNSLQNRVEEDNYKCDQNFTSLQQEITLLQAVLNRTAAASQQYYDQLSSSVWSIKLWLSSEMSNQIAPVIEKMSNFSKKLRDKEQWDSSPFFTFEGGYQMCLRVDAAGNDEGEGTHVSVYLYLVKGPHDDELEQSGHWPLRGTFTIELLNQLNDSDHYSQMLQFHHHLCGECTDRVLGDEANTGWGYPQFISHDILLHHSNNSYHKSDYLMFRISYDDMEAPYQVAPVSFKVTKFSHWLKDKAEWSSSPFFTFKEGYQLYLNVYAAGYYYGEGTHVSVFLHLTKGPHDDELEQSGHWPLRGTFTIELLNQLNDSDHYSRMIQFHHHICRECTNRVLEGDKADAGWGYQQFISHDTLLHYSNNSYRKSDYLMFRISYEDMEAPYQVAPVSFKVTKFSHWLKDKANWYSSSFFAFDGGYQLYLSVDADGYAEGEGTHVSVYLYLMKGPHDVELEQLGHWPLRGTFTIELLNQLNDSDHYSHMIQFHHHVCRECTNRVLEGDEADAGWGSSQFISHNALINNSYHISDSLIFRISYKDDMEALYQVAPVNFAVTKFSHWLKNNDTWYSSLFFAYEKGYQLYLKIYSAGNGEGEGTHVSVYLCLTKGPHDDELEQSGYWPLRGTFTIELLNQLNDSDHYSSTVMFDANGNVTKVKDDDDDGDDDDGIIINAMPQFISHNALFQHNGYLINDVLNFRISYLANFDDDDDSKGTSTQYTHLT